MRVSVCARKREKALIVPKSKHLTKPIGMCTKKNEEKRKKWHRFERALNQIFRIYKILAFRRMIMDGYDTTMSISSTASILSAFFLLLQFFCFVCISSYKMDKFLRSCASFELPTNKINAHTRAHTGARAQKEKSTKIYAYLFIHFIKMKREEKNCVYAVLHMGAHNAVASSCLFCRKHNFFKLNTLCVSFFLCPIIYWCFVWNLSDRIVLHKIMYVCVCDQCSICDETNTEYHR